MCRYVFCRRRKLLLRKLKVPELPDVEVFKKYIDSTSLHQKIKDVDVNNSKVLKAVSQQKLKNKLKNRSLDSTRRYGKFLFIHTEMPDTILVLHFGMTGSLKYYKDNDPDIPHVRVMFSFTNGYHLAYISQRMLGKVSLTSSVDEFIKNQKWGPDALDIDFQKFEDIVKNSHGAVKTTLMNQKLIAGIGNIYADEILFHSKIHPKTTINRLRQADIKRLYQNTKQVLDNAIKWHADPANFTGKHLLPNRSKNKKCPVCGDKIHTVKISGRTAYFCPDGQS